MKMCECVSVCVCVARSEKGTQHVLVLGLIMYVGMIVL